MYAYIRRFWRTSNDDSKDLCQGFFVWFLERGDLGRLTRNGGSFRGFLKTALRRYRTDGYRQGLQWKRADRRILVSLDEITPQTVELAASYRTPELEFDARWALSVLESAVDELERRLAAEGKGVYAAVLRQYCLTSEEPTYREVGERLGVSQSDVRNHLHHCRERLRALLNGRLRQ